MSASYIWIVFDEMGGLVAVFTVRHEMASWLVRCLEDPDFEEEDITQWRVLRIRDGASRRLERQGFHAKDFLT